MDVEKEVNGNHNWTDQVTFICTHKYNYVNFFNIFIYFFLSSLSNFILAQWFKEKKYIDWFNWEMEIGMELGNQVFLF